MWDIVLATAQCALMLLTAYLGIHVTLHPTESSQATRNYKIGFAVCAFVACCLIGVQAYRSNRAQNALNQLLTNIDQNTKNPPREEGYVVLNKVDVPSDMSQIVAGHPFGFNAYAVNPTHERVFDGYAAALTGLVDITEHKDDPDAEAKRVLADYIAGLDKVYAAGNIKGPDLALGGQSVWGTGTYHARDAKDVKKILSGDLRIYLITYMAWMDSKHMPHSSYDCRWLQNPSVHLGVCRA